ncbi:hypothetical protein NFI96_023336, partial [Prochilodus magdalenae]
AENKSPDSCPKECTVTNILSNIHRSEGGADAVNDDVGNVTFKFLGTEAEVEVSENSEISDESVLIRALTLEVGAQTINNTTVTCAEDTETVLPIREHVDHPYCTSPSDEPSCVNMMMQDGKLNEAHEFCSVNHAATCAGVDFSAVSPREMKSLTSEQADLTFKSFTCPGGEIEVADCLIMQDDLFMAENSSQDALSQSFKNESDIFEEYTELPVSPSHHTDHPYCHCEMESSISKVHDCTQTVENLEGVVSDANLEGHVQNLSSAGISAAPSQLVEELKSHEDMTFRPLIFPGAEIEIENTHDMSVISMLMKNLTVDSHLQSFFSSFSEHEGETTAILPPNSKHTDHPYCCPESVISKSEADIDQKMSSNNEENKCKEDLSALNGFTHTEVHCNNLHISSEHKDMFTDVAEHAQSYSSQASVSMSVENSGMEFVNVIAQREPSSSLCHCSEHVVENSKVLQCQENQHVQPSCSQANIDMSAENLETICAKSQTSLLNHNETKVVSSRSLEFQDGSNQQSVSDNLENKAMDDLTDIIGCSALPVEVQSDLSVSHIPSEEKQKALSPSKLSSSQADVNVLPQNTISSCYKPNAGIEAECSNSAVQSQHSPPLYEETEKGISKGLHCQQNIDQQIFLNNEEKNMVAQNTVSSSCQTADNMSTECVGTEFGNQSIPTQHADVELKASVVQDSALGLSGVHSGAEILRAESLHECHADAVPLHSQLWNALTMNNPSTPRNAALSRSVLQENPDSCLWPELFESPMPPPQFNSTAMPQTPTPLQPHKLKAAVKPKEKVPALDFSTMGKGPLQQQLRQMAELLILASGKIAAPPTPALVQRNVAEVGTTPVQNRSAAVCTTPVLRTERSVNTSALVEVVKEVSDACTSTDPLLWSVSPSSLQFLSKSELEQKLLSTLIMVEVLSQQLSSAKSHTTGTGPGPSELRDRLVQTEHTQLSQTGPYKELYLSALERIHTLEEDQDTLQNLDSAMQQMRNTMTTVKEDTEEALSSMKQIESIVNEDQEILNKQAREVKAMYARCMGTLRKMKEKCTACLLERDAMRQSMEDAFQEKHTVLRVLEQLRVHHSVQVSDLQHSLGSQQELTAALTHTYPQLVELNRLYVESLSAASALLKEKLNDHECLSVELHKAQWLLQKTKPVLQKLQQRASAAIEQRHLFQAERDIAIEEKAQMEVELEQAHASLQDADQQIADQNTQITILNSEMAVLREQLCEVEEERAQLQRKSTELSATVSSTLASYAFLEQALASETSKLQRSLHETQDATDRADSLQAALEVSQQRVEELEGVLAQRDTLLTELHAEVENQRFHLRRLTQIQADLSSAREMGEFLQAENELNREQLAESEGLLRSHLQGLRERNLECEDLRLALQQLRVERDSLQEELRSTRDKARVMLLEQGEQLAQATLDVSLLQHRVRCLTSNTHSAVTSKSSETQCQDELQQQLQAPRQPCGSFVNSVMLALTEEPEADASPCDPVSAEEENMMEGIGSRSSAFTRLPPAALKHADENSCSTTLVELLASLGDGMSELQLAIEELKNNKDAEINSLQSDINGLQEALHAESNRHRVEEAELRQQVGRLKVQSEKDVQVLQQKTQDEKALRKLCSELEENMEAAQKHRAENSELRREGAELRRALQQSQVEVEVLRAELTQSNDQSAANTKELDDKIRHTQEVEKLKAKLMEVEESRAKLLERAKRHQMVHAMNQSKLERELHMLDDMIETVRKTLSSVPEVVKSCPELQKLVEFLG